LIDPTEAFVALKRCLTPLSAVPMPIELALHRVLAEAAHSPSHLPPFAQSAMDGYAVRREDISSARESAPTNLPISLIVAAEQRDAVPPLGAGTCARIYTGAPIPKGADAVVAQELVTSDGEIVSFTNTATRGQCIRWRGEEVSSGDLVLDSGERLTAARLGALAATGLDTVSVSRMPTVHVWIGGDELAEAGDELKPGQVYDANGPLVASWLAARGVPASRFGRLPDTLEATTAALEHSLSTADLTITTGGVSVGDRDFIVPAAQAVGAEVVFWKVAQKPGKPMLFAIRDGKALLGLPGNPGAVYASLALHVARALDLLEGAYRPAPQWRRGVIAATVTPAKDRTVWLRASTSTDDRGRIVLTPLARQASHMVSNLATCDALVWVPPGRVALEEGTVVRWCPA
jgi:molybdopterin molybdotransferase